MILESVTDLFVAQRRALLNVPGAAERSVVSHRRVYDAIAARNAQEARKAMADHLKEVMREFDQLGWTDEGLLPTLDLDRKEKVSRVEQAYGPDGANGRWSVNGNTP
jgi:hypothetical protein